MQGEVQFGYSISVHTCLIIDQRLLVPAWRRPGYVRQVRAVAVVYN